MNDNNFNASQLTDLYDIFETMKKAATELEYAGWGSRYNDDICALIDSEDSNLVSSWRKSMDITSSIVAKVDSIISRIREEFEAYIKSTLINEESAAQKITSINRALEEDIEMLKKIEI